MKQILFLIISMMLVGCSDRVESGTVIGRVIHVAYRNGLNTHTEVTFAESDRQTQIHFFENVTDHFNPYIGKRIKVVYTRYKFLKDQIEIIPLK
jgi:uncharacterized lipoprotein NlpE involved in copper resistance